MTVPSSAAPAHDSEHGQSPGASEPQRLPRLRPRPRRPRAQPQERRRRHPARRPGRLHRRLRVRQIVARVRHALRRGAAALPRIGQPVRPPAVPPDGAAAGRRDRRPAAGRGAAAAARLADDALVASAASRRSRTCCACSTRAPATTRRGQAHPVRRVVLAEHAGGRVPDVPRARADLRRDRSSRWCRTTRRRSASARSPRGRRRGTGRTCATSSPRSAIDIDMPWRELPKKDRDWLLFTDEQPTVPVYAGWDRDEVRRAIKRKEEPSYMGTFTGARKYVLQTFATTQSALMKKRVCAVHGQHRVPRLPRQAAAARGAVGEVRRARHRRHLAPAAEAARRDLPPLRRRHRAAAGRSWKPSTRRRRRSPGGSPRTSRPASTSCSTSASATSRSSAARRRSRPASCSGCGWRRRCARTCSASSTCSTSPRPACTRPTPRRCCARSTG